MTTEEAKLVESCMGMIYKLAGKFYGVEKEDLIQAGALAALKASRTYNKESGAKFSTYAYTSIFGEMYQLACSMRQIKVSRDLLKLYQLIEMTRYSLAQKRGYIPTNTELARFLEKEEWEIEAAIEAGSVIVSSLDKSEEKDRSIYETVPANEGLPMDEQIALQESMEALSPEERQIIEYRYFQDLTQSEVARKLKKTQVMVSRYEKKGINKMREYYINN